MGRKKSLGSGCLWFFIIACLLVACFSKNNTQTTTETNSLIQTEATTAITTIEPTTTLPTTTTVTTTSAPTTIEEATKATTKSTKVKQAEEMVWIPRTGSKYHRYSGCSKMKNPSQVSISTAQNKGYTPCKKCY